jgi:hypothetical protein
MSMQNGLGNRMLESYAVPKNSLLVDQDMVPTKPLSLPSCSKEPVQ